MHKGGIASGRVNTTVLINNERNSIIAEFCRRVHAVVWGRSLFKTKRGKLGLATNIQKGDNICILYGCTVPVILEKRKKGDGKLDQEIFEDRFEMLKSSIWKLEKICERKAKYRAKKEKDGNLKKKVKEDTDMANNKLNLEKKKRETIERLERSNKNESESKRSEDLEPNGSGGLSEDPDNDQDTGHSPDIESNQSTVNS